jgi:hypothetical protein
MSGKALTEKELDDVLDVLAMQTQEELYARDNPYQYVFACLIALMRVRRGIPHEGNVGPTKQDLMEFIEDLTSEDREILKDVIAHLRSRERS